MPKGPKNFSQELLVSFLFQDGILRPTCPSLARRSSRIFDISGYLPGMQVTTSPGGSLQPSPAFTTVANPIDLMTSPICTGGR